MYHIVSDIMTVNKIPVDKMTEDQIPYRQNDSKYNDCGQNDVLPILKCLTTKLGCL
jgi:hypothetical protein